MRKNFVFSFMSHMIRMVESLDWTLPRLATLLCVLVVGMCVDKSISNYLPVTVEFKSADLDLSWSGPVSKIPRGVSEGAHTGWAFVSEWCSTDRANLTSRALELQSALVKQDEDYQDKLDLAEAVQLELVAQIKDLTAKANKSEPKTDGVADSVWEKFYSLKGSAMHKPTKPPKPPKSDVPPPRPLTGPNGDVLH